MMKCKVLLLLVMAAVALNAAQIKDVKFACDKGCRLVFSFASANNLPTFFQKYDASSKKLTVGFSGTDIALGEGFYEVDASSKYVRNLRVYKENYKGSSFLKLEMSVGAAIASDKNAISLEKSNFLLKFNGKSGKAWTLSKIAAKSKNSDSKAAIEDKKAAEKAAKEEKKRLAAEKKAAEKQALLDKKAAEKAAKEEAKLMAEQQKQLDKAISQGGAISALIPNIQEMTVLLGSGMEQFRLVAKDPIEIRNVSNPDNASVITVGMAGPSKSPVFKIGSSSLVKYVTWGANGLKIQLHTGVQPVVMVVDGTLILQVKENALRKEGFVYWSARPSGIYIRDWMTASEDVPNFDRFVTKYEKDSKKIISASQTFHLRPIVRELIVVSDEIELYAAPNDNSQVLHRLVFGDRLVSLDLKGLYRRVQFGNRVGYVNKRAVSFFDELSSVQSERLKQVDKDNGDKLVGGQIEVASQLDGMYEDRVTYSSFGRRDPFVEIKGLVEEGINIDQVELMGIIWESEIPMAILVESKNPSISYTVKEGDKILNGKVLKITQTDVLFLIQEFGVSRRYSMALPDKYGGKK